MSFTDTYLSHKDPKEHQCDVPREEEEAGTDPQVVDQGEVQQPSYAVKRMDRATDGEQTQTHSFSCMYHARKYHSVAGRNNKTSMFVYSYKHRIYTDLFR